MRNDLQKYANREDLLILLVLLYDMEYLYSIRIFIEIV